MTPQVQGLALIVIGVLMQAWGARVIWLEGVRDEADFLALFSRLPFERVVFLVMTAVSGEWFAWMGALMLVM